MAIRNIANNDSSYLAITCKKANPRECYDVVTDLADTALAHSDYCCGLSSNQIGYSSRVCLIRSGEEEFILLINPIIVGRSNSTFMSEEYCLSYPERSFTISRYNWIDVIFSTTEGKIVKKRFTGPMSAFVQHEIDHLNGKVMM